MARLVEVLVPARFMLTIGHLVALLMLITSKRDNIWAGLKSDASASDYDRAKFEFQVAYSICLVCFGFDMIGHNQPPALLTGATIFFNKANMVHVVCHFAGGCLLATMIEQVWAYQYIWMVVALCNLPTALVEITILVAIFGFKIVVF